MISEPRDHGNGGEPDFGALAALVDGRLTAAERASVLDHLAGCARCRTIVAELTRGRDAPARGWSIRTLPVAATLAVAAAGAGLYWMVRDRMPGQPSAPPVETQPVPPAPAAPRVEAPAPGTSAGTPSRTAPPDVTRDAGTTVVDGKTFRLVAGEWIDAEYRPTDFLPVVVIRSRDELDGLGELKPFVPLGSRFTVIVNGTVYRVAVPPVR